MIIKMENFFNKGTTVSLSLSAFYRYPFLVYSSAARNPLS